MKLKDEQKYEVRLSDLDNLKNQKIKNKRLTIARIYSELKPKFDSSFYILISWKAN